MGIHPCTVCQESHCKWQLIRKIREHMVSELDSIRSNTIEVAISLIRLLKVNTADVQ